MTTVASKEASRAGRVSRWWFIPVVAAIAIVAGTAVLVGPDRYSERGDQYPGALASAADMVGYLVGVGSAMAVFGLLVFIVVGARPDSGGALDVSVYRAQRLVAQVASALAVLGLAMMFVAAADASGITVSRMISAGYLGDAVDASEEAKAWVVLAVAALVVAAVARFSLSWLAHLVAVIPASVAALAVPMAGNAGQGPNHDYTTGFVICFVIAVSMAIGARVGWLGVPGVVDPAHRTVVRTRVAIIVLAGDVVALVAGIAIVAFWVPVSALLGTGFGVAATAMVVLLAGAVITDLWRWPTRRDDTAEATRVMAGALLMVGVLVCWTLMETRVAPRFLAHEFTAWEVFLGYELPGPPTAWRLAYFWRFDVFIGSVAIAAAVLYGIGVWRLRQRGDAWPVGRTVSWMLGCVALVVFTGSGIRAYGSALFSVHMAEHMALNMFVPVLLVLGAPATLALRALPTAGEGPPGPREWLLRTLHSPITRALSNPVVALLLFVLSLYVVYFTEVFATLAAYHWGHVLLTIHFVIVGYLFFWVIIGIDPGPRRIPFLARIGLLFAVMPFHAFFGIALMTMSTIVAESFYSQLSLPWFDDQLVGRLDDQWLGGAIAWGASEVPVVLVVVAIVYQWARTDRRAAKRADRHAETYEDDELASYNAMLSELTRNRK